MADDIKLKKDAAPAPDDFDIMVEELAAEIVPKGGMAEKITPWKSAMYKVVIGLAFLIVQFNFWGLNYILPLVGCVLLLIGSRTLRKENGGFRSLFAAAIIMAVLRGFLLISAASCLWALSFAATMNNVIGIPGLILNLWLLVAFRIGLAETMEKAGTESKTGWATAAILWYLVVIILGLTGLAEALVFVLVAIYVLIIIALLIQTHNMDRAGYALQTEAPLLSNLGLGGIYVGIIVVGIIVCGLLFSRLPMNWQSKSGVNTQVAKQAVQQLAELGVPESVINDLGEDDLAVLWGADKVLIQELPENKTNDPTLGGLLLTHVAVRTPSGANGFAKYTWHFIHHFEWPGSVRFAGIETIHMDALFKVVNSNGQMIDNTAANISGRVLMDKDGEVYEAPYYGHPINRPGSGNNDDYVPWSTEFRLDRTIFDAKFSFPYNTENARGYIMYDAWINIEDCIFESEMSYWHHKGLTYPFYDPSIAGSPMGSWSYMQRSEQVRFSTLD